MIKFRITPERVAEAASVIDYIGSLQGNIGSQMRLLPKLVIDKDGQYIVEIVHDEDGDILEFKNLDAANLLMDKITPARFEKLRGELQEALRNMVNPTNGGGSVKPSPQG